jgi:hypothetical protein
LAREAEADLAAHAAAAETASARSMASSDASAGVGLDASPAGDGHVEQLEVVLDPGQARDFKLSMKQGASVRYEWFTDWGAVSFDMSGAPADGSPDARHAYAESAARSSDEGVLVAAFDGLHGWLWRNAGNEAVTVTLRVQGDFQALREIK